MFFTIFRVFRQMKKKKRNSRFQLQLKFILACQDTESGGFSDRPGDMVDPFHTLFGLTAMSLLDADSALKPINPTYCMPEYVIERLGLKPLRLDS